MISTQHPQGKMNIICKIPFLIYVFIALLHTSWSSKAASLQAYCPEEMTKKIISHTDSIRDILFTYSLVDKQMRNTALSVTLEKLVVKRFLYGMHTSNHDENNHYAMQDLYLLMALQKDEQLPKFIEPFAEAMKTMIANTKEDYTNNLLLYIKNVHWSQLTHDNKLLQKWNVLCNITSHNTTKNIVVYQYRNDTKYEVKCYSQEEDVLKLIPKNANVAKCVRVILSIELQDDVRTLIESNKQTPFALDPNIIEFKDGQKIPHIIAQHIHNNQESNPFYTILDFNAWDSDRKRPIEYITLQSPESMEKFLEKCDIAIAKVLYHAIQTPFTPIEIVDALLKNPHLNPMSPLIQHSLQEALDQKKWHFATRILDYRGINKQYECFDNMRAIEWTLRRGEYDFALALLDSGTIDLNFEMIYQCSNTQESPFFRLNGTPLDFIVDQISLMQPEKDSTNAIERNNKLLKIAAGICQHPNTTINVRSKNQYGDTALHRAIRRNTSVPSCQNQSRSNEISNLDPNLDLIQTFLKNTKVDLGIKNNKGQTALHLAVLLNRKEIVRFLLDQIQKLPHSKDIINAGCDCGGATALHIAIENRYEQIAHTLLEADADPMINNETGYTAVHFAALYSCWSTLRMLLEKLEKNNNELTEIITNKTDKNKTSVLECAAQSRSYPVIDNLSSRENDRANKAYVFEQLCNIDLQSLTSNQRLNILFWGMCNGNWNLLDSFLNACKKQNIPIDDELVRVSEQGYTIFDVVITLKTEKDEDGLSDSPQILRHFFNILKKQADRPNFDINNHLIFILRLAAHNGRWNIFSSTLKYVINNTQMDRSIVGSVILGDLIKYNETEIQTIWKYIAQSQYSLCFVKELFVFLMQYAKDYIDLTNNINMIVKTLLNDATLYNRWDIVEYILGETKDYPIHSDLLQCTKIMLPKLVKEGTKYKRKTIESILEFIDPITILDSTDNPTLFHIAADEENWNFILALTALWNGQDKPQKEKIKYFINIKDLTSGKIALHYALEGVKKIIQDDATDPFRHNDEEEIRQINKNKETKRLCKDALDSLFYAGSDPNIENNDGISPLMLIGQVSYQQVPYLMELFNLYQKQI